MEKVKNAFSSCGAWIKAHLKVVIAVIAVIIVAIIVVNLIGGSEKRVIKKHLAAVTACDDSKVLKTMDLEAAIAYSRTLGAKADDFKENFNDNLDKVKDDGKDDVKSYKESIEKAIDKDDKGKGKVKLLKIVYTTKSKDDKNLKKVVAKVRATIKPDKDDDDDEDESIWKKEKKYTRVTEYYTTFILYKNKIISSDFVPSYSSYDYSDYNID